MPVKRMTPIAEAPASAQGSTLAATGTSKWIGPIVNGRRLQKIVWTAN